MRITRLRRWPVALLVCCGIVQPALGGGIRVDKNSVVIEGPTTVKPRSEIKLRFQAQGYAYGSREYAYLPVAVIAERESLRPSIDALSRWDIYGITYSRPDEERSLDTAANPYRLSFFAPETPGRYKIVVHTLPLFRPEPLKSAGVVPVKQSFTPHTLDRSTLADVIAQTSGAIEVLTHFEVSVQPTVVDRAPPVYLRVNGRPASQARLIGGIQDSPVTFNWWIGPEFKGDRNKVSFRYRLEPEDDTFGAWTSADRVSYSFLLKGVHQFQVQARYRDDAGLVDSVPAVYGFNLPKEHISRPTRETLTKTSNGSPAATSPPLQFESLYARSRALIVGMWQFDDVSRLPQFDETKITRDVSTMTTALQRNGFEITTLKKARVTREEIDSALFELVEASGRDDRILVYFSSHGFPDPNDPARVGYLATSDCKVDRAPVRCLRLDTLQNHATTALESKQVRQMLFAIDSCFSGLGITIKAPSIGDLSHMAVRNGAFMLTAGMRDQRAEIDPDLGMSTFTHYLADGLNGSADILENDLITLSELFLYVQHKVAQRTHGQQIPMLGRMKGDGEMLFLPAATNSNQ